MTLEKEIDTLNPFHHDPLVYAARSIVAQIEEFETICNEAGKTDTGDVWELLIDWHHALKKALGHR